MLKNNPAPATHLLLNFITFAPIIIKMLVFPNCKINLGLHVTAKRPDGFHDIETVFYPVGWCDAVEVIENKTSGEGFTYSQSGLVVDGPVEQNLLYKAWKIVSAHKSLPPLKVHLHKNIPMGAGLGGGSSDAAHFINLLNQRFQLALPEEQRLAFASELGSDCAFFIKNAPVMASGRGDRFSPVTVNLAAYHILLVHPGIHSNTKEAYQGIVPKKPEFDLTTVLGRNPSEWKDLLVNDFETTLFARYPEIKALKEKLYAAGALYACMSGSGSAVFGIFGQEPDLQFPHSYKSYLQKPAGKIL